ncbi:MAG: DNA-3-methyladenine glycosylase 2 family protein [Ferruginibacter sp.]|nr:DNA-3-methyladenine glycosylase 2 family protein [Ferruginibacter sp.]
MDISTFNKSNFLKICKDLCKIDADLAAIINQYGFPPMWSRPATFQTLVLTILEQQVSLASAYAAFKKLKEKVGYVTPQKILALTDEEMRACYFTRQKMGYARGLAMAIQKKQLVLSRLTNKADDEIRAELEKLKGIGDWTVDVYLMHALQRSDLFPLGDIALVNSMRENKNLGKDYPKEKMLALAEPWKPYRSVATMILWHAYIKKRNMKILG